MASMAPGFPRLMPLSQDTLLLEVGDTIDPDLLAQVRGLAEAIESLALPGLVELIPAYASLLVCCERPQDARRARAAIEPLLREPPRVRRAGRSFRVPCCYEGEFAPDLELVAPEGDPARAVALHTGQDFLVYCIGFLPGFAYLGELPAALAAPRLPVPRPRVPAGSVGVAGRQTGIYPVDSPGGWRVIGRTPVRLFDVRRNPPAALQPADRVRFYPIGREEYDQLAEARPWLSPSSDPAC